MRQRNSSRGAVSFLERSQFCLTLSEKLSQCNFVIRIGKGGNTRSNGHCVGVTEVGGEGYDSWYMKDDLCNDVSLKLRAAAVGCALTNNSTTFHSR